MCPDTELQEFSSQIKDQSSEDEDGSNGWRKMGLSTDTPVAITLNVTEKRREQIGPSGKRSRSLFMVTEKPGS